jgi:two-component system, sensor histidine kinase and response regulator
MKEFQPSLFYILMVDDNPKNLQLLGSTLRNEGYRLEFATNGSAALNWIQKANFDLILLDVMMPELSGFDVCKEIRTNEKYENVPIIFLTAKTDKESVIEGFEFGAQDYITKPFDTAELLARVKTQLELKYSKEELIRFNQNLEEIVKERTKELQQAMSDLVVANEKLLILDKAKSEFLHIISHEIRTPLNGIKGSLEMIRDNAEESSIKNLFHILDASVNRLEKFSIIALKITQLKIGKYKPDLQPIPCKLIINTALKKVDNALRNKSISIQNNIENNEEAVWCDFEAFSGSLVSIIDNAVKYSPVNSKIELTTIKNEKLFFIKIKDEGPGFSNKAQENLFQLFAPGEKHVNENEGLELALAKLILDAHKGSLDIENLTKGAEVTLSLPLVPDEF